MWTRSAQFSAIYASLWLACVLSVVPVCNAQGGPAEDCKFAYDGFATSPGQKVQIAEVKGRFTLSLKVAVHRRGVSRLPLLREHLFRFTGKRGYGPVAMFPDTTELDRPGFVLAHSPSSATATIHRSLHGQEHGQVGRIT